MNTSKLARTTLVLDRETHNQLNRISHRFGVSRSSLVRDCLAEPVAMLAKWVDLVPESATQEEKDALAAGMLGDLEVMVDREMKELRDV